MVGLLLGFLGPHRAAFVAKMRQRRRSVPHPEGRSAAEDGKARLSWSAATARKAPQAPGKKVGHEPLRRATPLPDWPQSKARAGVAAVFPRGERTWATDAPRPG
ncbi:hypothetical protein APZ00_10260 [Pannonibacter phragmitetus]|uniref:Uncharacterized protein n=1 Tax=Pannonibacter phragmitetus TaxID=121719 RepID=A0A0U3E779_9HYPH|nr:hypothetical protein APZ00_10260 [Pannonibacter phragmitetus]